MCKSKTNRAMSAILALVMAFALTTPAFAYVRSKAYDYYEPKNIEPPRSLEDAERYSKEWFKEDYRERLYEDASDELFIVPTDLKPTPLPEELGLDPATYWTEISSGQGLRWGGNTSGTTTRPIDELYQEICELVDELTAGLTTESEKYAAICRWVDENIKSSKQNRTQNVYLAYEHRYGMCMERSHLKYLMATIAGLKPCLVESFTTVEYFDLPVGYPHLATAIIEEHGIWVGDATKFANGDPMPTAVFYLDGTTKYKMDLKTGETKVAGEIKAPNTQPEKPEKPAVAFTDVPADAWYAGAVDWAIAKGITNGTSETTFSPNRECTQCECLVFLWRTAGNPAVNGVTLPFTVRNAWATDALKWAYSKGIINNSFDENAPCTRYTAVSYIWQAFGSPTADTTVNFNDIAGLDTRPIAWAVGKGIVNGTSATTFSPNMNCNRATIVTLLQRSYK